MSDTAVPAGGFPWKILLIGCGAVGVLCCAAGALFVGWFASLPESGVKMANQMDEYALEYLEEHGILDDDEDLVAYYDVTISMTGEEAAILTTERVVYHKSGSETSIDLDEIESVDHRYEGLNGDIIDVKGEDGQRMRIEIAPLNQGEDFYDALVELWEGT